MPGHPRLLGLLPLLFLGWALTTYESPWQLLWICNLCNLAMAIGLLAGSRRIIGLATLWLVLAAPLWVWDMFVQQQAYPHSFFTHLVCPGIGLVLLRGRVLPTGLWKWALGFGVLAQAASRALTPAEFNINVSHATYEGLGGFLSNYAVYWAMTFIAIGAALLLVQRVLERFWLAPGRTG